jgi:hypothetical protein
MRPARALPAAKIPAPSSLKLFFRESQDNTIRFDPAAVQLRKIGKAIAKFRAVIPPDQWQVSP